LCHLAAARALAGEFEIEDAMVDNTQTAEDFAFTRMPTIDAPSVQFTTEPEFGSSAAPSTRATARIAISGTGSITALIDCPTSSGRCAR